jgi:hypothetical protein
MLLIIVCSMSCLSPAIRPFVSLHAENKKPRQSGVF